MSSCTGLSGLFASGPVAERVSERSLLEAMVEVELALLRASARVGLAPPGVADALPEPAELAAGLDVAALGRGTGEQGTPVPELVRQLRARLGAGAAAHLHRGATSQDVLDTALSLLARRALAPLSADLAAAAGACAELAERFRDSPAIGRTLLQHAVPVTFGLKGAAWLTALDEACAGLADADGELAVQLGGAAGTLAALDGRGTEVMAALGELLGLAVPTLPWHTDRVRPARLACALGIALGALGKIGRDIVLLSQTEVAEVSEAAGAGRGGSSAMPHKRNPVGAVALVAAAQRGPGLVATILACLVHEHERAAGAWQAEWEPLLELLRLTGSAAAAARALLDGLEPHPERMRANLELTGGLVMSESVVAALTDVLGRSRAQELVGAAARHAAQAEVPLRDVLAGMPEITALLDPAALDAALAPEGSLGEAGTLIDRALAAHRAGTAEAAGR